MTKCDSSAEENGGAQIMQPVEDHDTHEHRTSASDGPTAQLLDGSVQQRTTLDHATCCNALTQRQATETIIENIPSLEKEAQNSKTQAAIIPQTSSRVLIGQPLKHTHLYKPKANEVSKKEIIKRVHITIIEVEAYPTVPTDRAEFWRSCEEYSM
jgi:hypothetical protein